MDGKELIQNTVQAIMGIVTVYGPIDPGDLLEWMEKKFSDLYELVGEMEIIDYAHVLEEQGQLFILEDSSFSIYPQENADMIEMVAPLYTMGLGDQPKEFSREELLSYGKLEDITLPSAIQLREYLETIQIKKGYTPLDIYNTMVAGTLFMADGPQIVEAVQKDAKTKLNDEVVLDILHELGGNIPRGFLKGYSLLELAKQIAENTMDDMDMDFEDHELKEIDDDYMEFGEYSYPEVQKLAKKVKKTNIFENIDSDMPIELLVNGERVYIQVLGYYNGDRNIIIYGDWEDFLYNYQFIAHEEGVYPDISYRITYSEIVLDKSEGFATPDVVYQLKKNKYAAMPLLVTVDPIHSVQLPDQDMLNTMGAVLEQLLIIDKQMDDEELNELCQSHMPFEVVQIHLYNEYMSTGSRIDLSIGDSVIPFEVSSEISTSIQAKTPTSISIGLYVFVADEKQRYVTLVCDNESGMVIAPIIKDEEEMKTLLNDIVDVLESHDIVPTEILTNNLFTSDILDPLYEVYGVEIDIDGELVDDVYDFFMQQAEQEEDEEPKH